MNESVFHIDGMDCPTEEQSIRNRLKQVAGVEELRFNLLARELTVRHTLADDQPLLAALRDVGMEPRLAAGSAGPARTRFLLPGMC